MDIDAQVINSVAFNISQLPLEKEELEVVTMILEGLDFKDMSGTCFINLQIYVTLTTAYCHFRLQSGG